MSKHVYQYISNMFQYATEYMKCTHTSPTSFSHYLTHKCICQYIMKDRITQLLMSIYSLSHEDGVMALTHHFLSTTHHNIRIMVPDCLSAQVNSPVKTIACILLPTF